MPQAHVKYHTPTLGDTVMSNIAGMRDAQRLIYAVRQGCAPADTMLEAMEEVRATADADRMRGFARELQKAVERGGQSA